MDPVLQQHEARLITDTELRVRLDGTDDSRYGRVKRAIRRGDLIPIRRGLYALAKKYRPKELNAFMLSGRIHGPSYISFESALSYYGWIPEGVYTTTAASAKRSCDFETPFGLFSYTKLPKRNFFIGVRREDQGDGDVFLIATPWKSFLDYCYIYKGLAHFHDVVTSLRIELDQCPVPSRLELRQLDEFYKRKRVTRIVHEICEVYGL